MAILCLPNLLSETSLHMDLNSGGITQRETKGSHSSVEHTTKNKIGNEFTIIGI